MKVIFILIHSHIYFRDPSFIVSFIRFIKSSVFFCFRFLFIQMRAKYRYFRMINYKPTNDFSILDFKNLHIDQFYHSDSQLYFQYLSKRRRLIQTYSNLAESYPFHSIRMLGLFQYLCMDLLIYLILHSVYSYFQMVAISIPIYYAILDF